jgi:hypothetical protein
MKKRVLYKKRYRKTEEMRTVALIIEEVHFGVTVLNY